MNVTAFAADPWAREAVTAVRRTVDPVGITWTIFEDWDLFVNRSESAVVAVAASESAENRDIEALQRRSTAGVIYMTHSNPAALRLERVVTLHGSMRELTSAFPVALHSARANGVLFSQAMAVSAAQHLTPIFRRMLAVPFTARPTIRTVTSLGALMPRSPTDLRYHWRAEARGGSPKQLLDWIGLERAVVSKSSRLSWEAHATALGQRAQTLRRASQRLLDLTLEEAHADHGQPVIEGFDAYLGRTLQVRRNPSANIDRD